MWRKGLFSALVFACLSGSAAAADVPQYPVTDTLVGGADQRLGMWVIGHLDFGFGAASPSRMFLMLTRWNSPTLLHEPICRCSAVL